LVLDEAKKQGYECHVAGIRGEATSNLKIKADEFEWISPFEISKFLSFFRKRNIHEVLMVGKVKPRTVYRRGVVDDVALRLLSQTQGRSPSIVLKVLIDYLTKEGIEVKDPTFLLTPYFCQEGVLTEVQPTPEVLDDIDFGWRAAKIIADLDIGQTIVVKDKAVVAVEGMEGTDETIKRAGRLAGEGIVVVKVVRTHQDMRIDIPALGVETLRNMIVIGGKALCLEALRMPFFQKDEALALANANGISVVAKKS